MANSDYSYNILRFDPALSTMQYFSGADWYNCALAAAGIADGSVTPAKISTSGSDNFVFPATAKASAFIATDGASVQREILIDGGQLAIKNVNTGYKSIAFSDADINVYASFVMDSGHDRGIFGGDWIYVGSVVRDPSVILMAKSTTKGFLPPVMTSTQKNAIATPTEGLVVYDNVLHALCVYDGSSWKTVTVS